MKICRNCNSVTLLCSTVLYYECVYLPLCHYPAVVSSDICLPQPLWMTLPALKREFTPFSFVFLFCFCRWAKVSFSLVFFLGSFSSCFLTIHPVFLLLLWWWGCCSIFVLVVLVAVEFRVFTLLYLKTSKHALKDKIYILYFILVL